MSQVFFKKPLWKQYSVFINSLGSVPARLLPKFIFSQVLKRLKVLWYFFMSGNIVFVGSFVTYLKYNVAKSKYIEISVILLRVDGAYRKSMHSFIPCKISPNTIIRDVGSIFRYRLSSQSWNNIWPLRETSVFVSLLVFAKIRGCFNLDSYCRNQLCFG